MSAVLKKTIGFSSLHRAGTMKIAPWVLVWLMSSVLLGVFKPHVPLSLVSLLRYARPRLQSNHDYVDDELLRLILRDSYYVIVSLDNVFQTRKRSSLAGEVQFQ